MNGRRHIFILLCWLVVIPASSQQFFRIRADVSVKTRLSTGDQSLTVGQVFYDRNEKKIVYALNFPAKEHIITADTVTYSIKEGRITNRIFSPSLVEFSVFHLSLSSNMTNYGLDKTSFQISDVQRDGELVITTWQPPENLADLLGQMKISVRDKKLFGVIFYSPEGDVSRKQLFENYLNVRGIVFPGRIVEISYTEEGENYQVMTFKNLVIDEIGHNDMYNYDLADL